MTRTAAVLTTALLASLILAPAALADEPIFGKATATSEFLRSITVEQPATLPSGVHRVEAYVRTGSGDVTFLADVPNPGAGDHLLRYTDPTPSGAMYPNTRVQLGFRVTFDDGRVVDSPPTTIRYEDTRFAWNTLEGDIVRVHWYAGGDAFGRRALRIGEQAIREASDLLGVTETDPIDYFVYADTSSFYDMLGPAIRENVGGIALPEIRTLFANIAPSDVHAAWVGIVVPHELTHLVFGTATKNPYHEPPHWMNEGLAVYLSEGYAASARANVERTARAGEIMPLRALVGQFPTTAQRFGLAYDESVSAIDYLIRTHGQEALVKLIRSYADGVSDDAAFSGALGVDVAGFEAGWLGDLGVDEPVPYGPRPAPPGPLPPDWAAAPASSGAPGSTGAAAPTFRTPSSSTGDVSGPVTIGVLAVLGVVLAVGLLVVARGLSRGQPLLAPLVPASDEDGDADDGDAQDEEP
jgi:peptidase MA superfamily protein